MMDTPWTPGPWEWDLRDEDEDDGTQNMNSLEGAEAGTVLYPMHRNDGTSDIGVPRPADARLIAAAPEMVDLLGRVISAWDNFGPEAVLDRIAPDARALLDRIRNVPAPASPS